MNINAIGHDVVAPIVGAKGHPIMTFPARDTMMIDHLMMNSKYL